MSHRDGLRYRWPKNNLRNVSKYFLEKFKKTDCSRESALQTGSQIWGKSYLWAWGKSLQARKWNFVASLDFVIIGWISKGQWEHTLLLQVGLVDTSKGLDNDGTATQVTKLTITWFLVKILPEHMKSKRRGGSALHFEYWCSVRILNGSELTVAPKRRAHGMSPHHSSHHQQQPMGYRRPCIDGQRLEHHRVHRLRCS